MPREVRPLLLQGMRALQVTCLRYLARVLTGSESVRGLKGYFEQRLHHYAYNIPEHFAKEVRHLASAAGWTVQATITVLPPSTPAVLIHWRILECFVAGLTSDQWAEFHRLGRLPWEGAGSREGGDAPRPQAERASQSEGAPKSEGIPQSEGTPKSKGIPQAEGTPQSEGAPGGPESGTTGPLPAESGAPDTSEPRETGVPSGTESPQGTGMASPPTGGAPPSGRRERTSAPSYANRAQRPPLPRAFDSHFHLDRLEDSLRRKKGLECVLATPGRPPRIPVHLCGWGGNQLHRPWPFWGSQNSRESPVPRGGGDSPQACL